jgi:2-keto-4-pentenoate hydratase
MSASATIDGSNSNKEEKPMAGMSASQIEEAARLLLDARRLGSKLESLPEPLRPASLEDAYAIQQTVARQVGRIRGWKVGAPNLEAAPLCGPMFAAGLKASPATLSSRAYPLRGLEAEVAFRIGNDLPPRSKPYSRSEVIDGIASCHAAIEELESRFADLNRMDNPSLVADSQSHGAFVFGPAVHDWKTIDWDREPVVLLIDGKAAVEGVGSLPAKDLLRLVTWLANEGAAWAGGLKAGDFVTTGSWTGKAYAGPGATVVARFPSLGEAVLTFKE